MLYWKPKTRAFTLIELLIVVAIIGILAAIAVPNFLEAQVRSKIARIKSEFRTIATGLESYMVDTNVYPWEDNNTTEGITNQYGELSYRAWRLTTPVAYLSSVDFPDPFLVQGAHGGYTDGKKRYQYNYRNHMFFWTTSTAPLYKEAIWVLNSIGPDLTKNQGLKAEEYARGLPNNTVIYDATNGTTSDGDIPWTGGSTRYTNK